MSLMFYKRLSDQCDHEADEAIKELERQQGREFTEPECAIFRKRGAHRSAIPHGSPWGDVKAASTNIGQVLTSHKRPRPTVVEEKLDVQAHVAVEVERETKLPAAGGLVSSISCQHVTVTAMPSDVLVDAARHHCRAVPIGACGHALIRARIDLGWNPRHC
jgi:hypothetical protein